jgi:hypothetical protein
MLSFHLALVICMHAMHVVEITSSIFSCNTWHSSSYHSHMQAKTNLGVIFRIYGRIQVILWAKHFLIFLIISLSIQQQHSLSSLPTMVIKVNGYDIEIDPSDTIWSLKWQIYHASQRVLPPPDDQRLVLIHTKRELNDCDKTVEFYDIHEGTEVKCKCKKRPGEEDFRKFVNVFRKRERTRLQFKGVAHLMTVGLKHVCVNVHEVRSISLHSKGVLFMVHFQCNAYVFIDVMFG